MMTSIQQFNPCWMKMKDFLGFCHSIERAAINTYGAVPEELKPLSDGIAALELAMEKPQQAMSHLDIQEADSLADMCILSAGAFLKGYERHFDESKRQAAEVLLAIYDAYPAIVRLSYKEEYASLGIMISDFLNVDSTLRDAIEFTPWIDELIRHRDAFLKLYGQFIEERSKVELGAVKTQQTALLDAYATAIQWINSMAVLHPDDKISSLISQINVLIDKVKTANKARKTRKNSAEPHKAG